MLFTSELQNASRLPYNSGASLYRAADVPIPIEQYGTDCIGKMCQLIGDSKSSDWQIIVAPKQDFIHFAGIHEGYYYDPHLFMKEPLQVEGSDCFSTVRTLLRNCYVRVAHRSAEELIIGYYREGIATPVHTYMYNLSQQHKLPMDRGHVNTFLPLQMKFATNNGYLCTVRYTRGSDPKLLTNDPVTTDDYTSHLYVETALQQQFGIGILEIGEYFRSAAEISAYFTSLMRLESQKRSQA